MITKHKKKSPSNTSNRGVLLSLTTFTTIGLIVSHSKAYASDLFGTVSNPLEDSGYGDFTDATVFISYIVRIITIAAGLYAFVNFALAGIQYIQSSGNPEGTAQAWAKIYQSIIGLSIVILSYVFAALLGLLLFGSADAILRPTIYGPTPPGP